MKATTKQSLMKISLVDFFGEKMIKAENVHFKSTDKSKIAEYNINVKDISSFAYYPEDLNGSTDEYSYVRGTFIVSLKNGNYFTFYNYTGGDVHVTNKSILATLYVSYEADAMKKFFDSNCKVC